MLINLLHIATAGVALFLIGANIAFLAHLGSNLVPWFRFKVAAVTLLLIYVALSASFANPSLWRSGIAVAALLIDVWALWNMWRSITRLAEQGIIGLVPILMMQKDQENN